jgi:hypothetical protein
MKELPPRGTRASRRGIDSPTLQDRPDAEGASTTPMAGDPTCIPTSQQRPSTNGTSMFDTPDKSTTCGQSKQSSPEPRVDS